MKKPPGIKAADLLSPADILFWAFQVIPAIFREKYPHPTEEEVAVQMGETLLHPRARYWLLRLGSRYDEVEYEEIGKHLEKLEEQRVTLAAYAGTGTKLPDRLQLAGEFFALGLRLATVPFVVRKRTRLQEQEAKRYTRNAKADRRRKNRWTAERAAQLFWNQQKWHLDHGRTREHAEREAMSYVIRHLEARP